MQQTTTLIEVPADLSHMYHDDPIVGKYRALLGHVVYKLLIAAKRDRPALLARKAQIHRQIRGRQVRLYRASPPASAGRVERQPVDDATLKMLFPHITINP
jgi:hypothetical protein